MTALASSPPLRTAPASRGVEPLRGESQAQFAERYHGMMAKAIPNTDRRNVEMMRCWRQSGMESNLVQAAEQKFGNAQFVHVPNVPVFSEHTTRDAKGNLVVYDRRALAAIADRCNTRILDTGDFPPLTEGHTPTAEEQNAGRKMPEVLGYSGPFRVGQIGNVNPRWAIFADEWHHRECVDKLRKMQRRSPEVWLEERMEDRFLDPIAALGAETPRLDLGSARYGQRGDGRRVEKYTATLPAAATTFVPGADAAGKKTDRKDRYEGQGMISPEDVDQIVQAIMASEPMQWVVQQMSSGPQSAANPAGEGMPTPEAPAAPEAGAVPGAPPASPAAPAPADPPAAPAEPDGDEGAYEPDDEDREQFRRYMADECSDEDMQQYRAHKKSRRKKHYAADGSLAGTETASAGGDVASTTAGKPSGDGAVADPSLMRLSRRLSDMTTQDRYAKLEAEVKDLREKNVKAEREKEMTERYSRVSDARQTRAFNVEDMQPFMDPAKYSREAFDAALKLATSSAEVIPVDVTLHVPRVLGESQDSKGKKARDVSDRAKAIATRYAKQGKHINYDEACVLAEQELAQAS